MKCTIFVEICLHFGWLGSIWVAQKVFVVRDGGSWGKSETNLYVRQDASVLAILSLIDSIAYDGHF